MKIGEYLGLTEVTEYERIKPVLSIMYKVGRVRKTFVGRCIVCMRILRERRHDRKKENPREVMGSGCLSNDRGEVALINTFFEKRQALTVD